MATYDSNVTGQANRPKAVEPIAASLPFGITTKAKLQKTSSPVNIEELSGKQLGAMVLVNESNGTKFHLAIATGSLPADPWHLMELTTDATPV
ncbi:MAG: hypothetical protein ACRDB3_17875 [Citrobacter telavivensis]